uniref:Uncharacterized protein n=1 Tax=Sphaerodactylus townsendi TaxID=933632 RepID=A0ACB8E4X1_9SAUR
MWRLKLDYEELCLVKPDLGQMDGANKKRLGYPAGVKDLSHSSELAFTVEPSDHISVQEQPLVLPCQVEGIQPISITWRKNGAMMGNSEDAFTLANGSLYFPLFQKLRGDGSSDEGEYECTARNRFGLVVSRKARIQAASKSRSCSLQISSFDFGAEKA